MVDFLEVVHQFLTEGITWSSAVAIILAIVKLRDSAHKRKVNEQTARDIAMIKEHLGCHVSTLGNVSAYGATKNERPFLSRLVGRFRAAIVKQFTIWRMIKMNNNINWVTLIVALLGAAKIVLEAFGIDIITDDVINQASNAVAAIVAIVGVLISHRKPNKEAVNNVANNDTYDYSGIDAERESAG